MSDLVTQEEAKIFMEAKFGNEPLEFQYGGKIINMFRYADMHFRQAHGPDSPMHGMGESGYNAILPSKRNSRTFVIEIEGIGAAMAKIFGTIENIVEGKERQLPKEHLLTLLNAIDSLLNSEHELGKKYQQVVEQTAQIFNIDMQKIRPSLANAREASSGWKHVLIRVCNA